MYFWANPIDIRLAWPRTANKYPGMETDGDLFLDMVESVTRDVLDRIGNDAGARYAFIRRFLDLAHEVVGTDTKRSPASPNAQRSS